jgi:hypothetical protein
MSSSYERSFSSGRRAAGGDKLCPYTDCTTCHSPISITQC